MALSSYVEYTQLIYHLLVDRPSVASHTLTVFEP